MTDKAFGRLLDFLELLAVSMLMIPLFHIFLGGTIPHDRAFLTAAAVLATFLGYGLQQLYASLSGKSAASDGFTSADRSVLGRFRAEYAAVPLCVIVLLTVGVYFLFDRYLLSLKGTLIDGDRHFYYTVLYSFEFAALFLVSAVVGCVAWFTPPERFAGYSVIVAGCAVFFIEFVFLSVSAMASGYTERRYVTGNIGLPFAIAFVCTLVIYNQTNLRTLIRGSVVTSATASGRRYNLLLVAAILAVFAAVTGLLYVIVAGLRVLALMLFYIVVYQLFHDVSNTPPSAAREYVDMDGEDAGRLLRRSVMTPENQYLVAWFFILVFLIGLLIFLFRSGLLKRFLKWLRSVIDTVLLGIDIYKNVDLRVYRNDNYKDEVKKLQNAGIRDYRAMAEATDSYRLFLTRLGRLRTYDEQLCYAYAVLLRMYRKMNVALKSSDTPREVEGKVVRALTESEIEAITRDFERVHYAGAQPDEREAAEILNTVCSAVKRYLY